MALAAIVVWFAATRVDVTSIIAVARDANPAWIAWAVLLLPANLFLEAYTWYPVLRRIVPSVSLRETLHSVLAGFPLGMFTPARIGDLAGRALVLHRGNKMEIALSAAVARLLDLLVILGAGTALLGFYILTGAAPFAGIVPLALVSVGMLVGIVSVIMAPRRIGRWVWKLPGSRRLKPHLQFLDELSSAVVLTMLGRSAARFTVYTTQFLFLAVALTPVVHVPTILAAVILTFLVKSVIPPVTFMDLGIREGAAAYFFGAFGLGAATGFGAGLMLFAINLVLPAIVGLPLISRYRLGEPTGETSPHPATGQQV